MPEGERCTGSVAYKGPSGPGRCSLWPERSFTPLVDAEVDLGWMVERGPWVCPVTCSAVLSPGRACGPVEASDLGGNGLCIVRPQRRGRARRSYPNFLPRKGGRVSICLADSSRYRIRHTAN